MAVTVSNGVTAPPLLRQFFSVYCNPTQANVTGDSSLYTFTGPLFSQATRVGTLAPDPTTGIITIPLTGIYQFNGNLILGSITTSFTYVNLYLEINGSAVLYCIKEMPFAAAATTPSYPWVFNKGFTAGDAITLNLRVFGGTKTVSLQGDTNVAGFLVGYV